MKITWWLPATIAFLVACSFDSSKKEAIKSPFLNLEKLGEAQSQKLKDIDPLVVKKVLTNGKSEEKTLKIDDWTKELEILKKANLDKPAFIGNYKIDTLKEGQFFQKTFTPLKSELSIKYQQIQLDSLGNLVHLESASEDKNVLYYTRKELTADFEVVSGKSILKNYATNAVQKIVGLDTFKLEVEVMIK